MAVVNPTANSRKQGSLAAGIGALIGIIAFLLLPYITFTVTIADTQFSSPQTEYASITAGTGLVSVYAGLVWGDALLAIAVLVLAALLLTRDAPFGASTIPVETQVRRASYAVIILGIVAIAYHFLFIASIGNGQIAGLLGSVTYGTNNSINNAADQLTQQHVSVSASMSNAFGAWIYIVGMVVSIIGGVVMLRAGAVAAPSPQAVSQPQSWPQYPQYSQPSQIEHPQAWQPNPAQQPQAWPQPTPPAQQGWQPTQQAQPQSWPPTQQAPQSWQQPPRS